MAFVAIIVLTDHTAATDIMSATLPPDHRLVGVYDFPDRSELTCTGNCVRKGSGAWTRDKSGFMKCAICGSRNKKIRRWFAGGLFDWFGVNIYPHAPALFRTPEGYGPSPRT